MRAGSVRYLVLLVRVFMSILLWLKSGQACKSIARREDVDWKVGMYIM